MLMLNNLDHTSAYLAVVEKMWKSVDRNFRVARSQCASWIWKLVLSVIGPIINVMLLSLTFSSMCCALPQFLQQAHWQGTNHFHTIRIDIVTTFVQRAAWDTITASWKQVVTLSNKFRKSPPQRPPTPDAGHSVRSPSTENAATNTTVNVELCFLKSPVTDRV